VGTRAVESLLTNTIGGSARATSARSSGGPTGPSTDASELRPRVREAVRAGELAPEDVLRRLDEDALLSLWAHGGLDEPRTKKHAELLHGSPRRSSASRPIGAPAAKVACRRPPRPSSTSSVKTWTGSSTSEPSSRQAPPHGERPRPRSARARRARPRAERPGRAPPRDRIPTRTRTAASTGGGQAPPPGQEQGRARRPSGCSRGSATSSKGDSHGAHDRDRQDGPRRLPRVQDARSRRASSASATRSRTPLGERRDELPVGTTSPARP